MFFNFIIVIKSSTWNVVWIHLAVTPPFSTPFLLFFPPHFLIMLALPSFNWYGNRSGKTWQEPLKLSHLDNLLLSFNHLSLIYCTATPTFFLLLLLLLLMILLSFDLWQRDSYESVNISYGPVWCKLSLLFENSALMSLFVISGPPTCTNSLTALCQTQVNQQPQIHHAFISSVNVILHSWNY